MNPTNQPVSFYGDNSRNTDSALLAALATKDNYAPTMDGVTASSIGCTRDQIGDLKFLVKDAESNIRSDVRQEGQDALKTSLEVEARLKDRLSIDRTAQDAQFLSLNNRLCESEKEAIKIGYENRLETIREGDKTREKISHLSERLGDKLSHGFEEVQEKLCDCCSEAAVRGVEQTGLLNLIANALNVGTLRAK